MIWWYFDHHLHATYFIDPMIHFLMSNFVRRWLHWAQMRYYPFWMDVLVIFSSIIFVSCLLNLVTTTVSYYLLLYFLITYPFCCYKTKHYYYYHHHKSFSPTSYSCCYMDYFSASFYPATQTKYPLAFIVK